MSICLGSNVSTELASKELSNDLRTLLVHFVDTGATVDLSDLVLFGIILDNRYTSLLVDIFEQYK